MHDLGRNFEVEDIELREEKILDGSSTKQKNEKKLRRGVHKQN